MCRAKSEENFSMGTHGHPVYKTFMGFNALLSYDWNLSALIVGSHPSSIALLGYYAGARPCLGLM